MGNKDKIKNLVILVLIFILGLFAYITLSNNSAKNEAQDLVDSLNDSLEVWKDKDSVSHAKIQIIETGRTKDFLKLKTTDSIVRNLQVTVEQFQKYLKKGGSVTNVTNVTEVHNHSKTIVEKDSEGNLIYRSKFNLDSWVMGDIVASKDTTLLNLKYKSDYSIILGTEKDGLFKRKSFVEVTDKNPYSSNLNVRTYQVKTPKPKRFGIGPYIGYGIGTGLVPQVNIGIGINYSLIQF